jgi:hypothetical protein
MASVVDMALMGWVAQDPAEERAFEVYSDPSNWGLSRNGNPKISVGGISFLLFQRPIGFWRWRVINRRSKETLWPLANLVCIEDARLDAWLAAARWRPRKVRPLVGEAVDNSP